MRWLRRIAYWLRFRSHADELREELSLHRELLAERYRAQGISAADADVEARRSMGNATYMREESRGVWLWPSLESLLQDWRYAWRGLGRSPAFTAIAVISLALGIGANTAIFGVIHALLLARIPAPNAERLVQLQRDFDRYGSDERFSRAEFDALVTGPVPLTAVASMSATVELNGNSTTASFDAIDGAYFDLLGLRAQRGRLITRMDDQAGAQIVVITDELWRSDFNADPTVIGKTIKVAGQTMAIVGITPAGFSGLRFPASTDMFIPGQTATALGLRDRDSRRATLTIVGVSPPSMPLNGARTEMASAWQRCCATGALTSIVNGRSSASTLRVEDISRGIPQVKLNLRGQYRRILFALMAGVAILLLAACANVANLLLARGSSRTGELAVRLALGASRARLVRQLVIESLQLSVLGAIAGAALAQLGTKLLVRGDLVRLSGALTPTRVPQVLSFAVAVSLLSGLVFGVVPAVRVMRSDLITPLKQGGRKSRGARTGALDRGLVALQMALALLLVSGATMLVQTLRNLQQSDAGFDATERWVVHVETRRTSYERQGMTVQMADEILRRVRALPGVRSAAFGSYVPVYGGRSVSNQVTVRGGAPVDDDETRYTAVSPEYFSSLGIPFRAGRDFEHAVGDSTNGRISEAIVNELFAKKFFPGRSALGQTFESNDRGDSVRTLNRVVGVVGNANFGDLRAAPTPRYFVPIIDHDWPFLELVVRPAVNVAGLGPAIASVVRDVAPGITQNRSILLSTAIDESLSRERMSAQLGALFAGIALSLVAVGLYGVLLFQVAERTTEIGVRVALGAPRARVVQLVLRQSLAVIAVGVAGGIPLSLLAGRAIGSQLYGVQPFSLVALAVASGSLVCVAIVASLVPVHRALRVDPLTALRAD